jgi:hypothetical protein
VNTRRTQLERREQPIEILDRSTTDQGERASKSLAERHQQFSQGVRYAYAIRPRRDGQQRAIHIQEQRVSGEIDHEIVAVPRGDEYPHWSAELGS